MSAFKAEPERKARKGEGDSCDVLKGASMECSVMTGVAHEIGNLLTVVSGWVQCWEQAGASSPEGVPAARYVYAGLGRIRYSLNRLDSAGPSTSNNLAVVDINSVLRHSLNSLDPRVERGYKLTKLTEPNPWPVVGDFWALDFVLVNLVMDAVAVSPPGTPILVKSNNVHAEEPVHGIGGFLAEGAYVSLSVHYHQGDVGTEPPRFSVSAGPPANSSRARENLPLCLRILEEHGGLLQMRDSSFGESESAILLPAVARCLRTTSVGGVPPE